MLITSFPFASAVAPAHFIRLRLRSAVRQRPSACPPKRRDLALAKHFLFLSSRAPKKVFNFVLRKFLSIFYYILPISSSTVKQ